MCLLVVASLIFMSVSPVMSRSRVESVRAFCVQLFVNKFMKGMVGLRDNTIFTFFSLMMQLFGFMTSVPNAVSSVFSME